MATQMEIKSGWLTVQVDKDLTAANDFLYFMDGVCHCVLMRQPTLAMTIIERPAYKTFGYAVQKAAAARPELKLIINGSYVDTDNKRPFGNVTDKAQSVSVTGTACKDEASLYINYGKTPRWNMAVSALPTSVDVGMGGLVPLVIKGTKIDDTNERYKKTKAYKDGPEIGRLAVAAPKGEKYLLVYLQPHGDSKGKNLDDLRDKLYDAGLENAVLLDGSSSVSMYLNMEWKELQKPYKIYSSLNGIGFFYKADTKAADT